MSDSEPTCDHWNTFIPGTAIQWRPIRCRRPMNHDGLHMCGSSSWSERVGERRPTSRADEDPCGGTGVVECWNPGGPCSEPNAASCEMCGVCRTCAPLEDAP